MQQPHCDTTDVWNKAFLELKEFIHQHSSSCTSRTTHETCSSSSSSSLSQPETASACQQTTFNSTAENFKETDSSSSSSSSCSRTRDDQGCSMVPPCSEEAQQESSLTAQQSPRPPTSSPPLVVVSMELLQNSNPRLAKWVTGQKTSVHRWEAGLVSNMTQERLDLLHTISFFHIFSNKYDEGWNEMFERLQRHYHETKHFYVEEMDLKRWMRKQRKEYELFEWMHLGNPTTTADTDATAASPDDTLAIQGMNPNNNYENKRVTCMTRERMDKLDSINFSSYDPSTSTSEPRFESRIEELKVYKLKHGNLNVPKRCLFNKSLGRWVTRIRAQYRLYQEGKPCGLTESRIQQLEALGFEWQSTSKFTANVTWDKRFQELVEYRNEHQMMTNVPKKYKANLALGTWVRNQRCHYWAKKRGKKSPMTEERIQKLESIGFQWNIK